MPGKIILWAQHEVTLQFPSRQLWWFYSLWGKCSEFLNLCAKCFSRAYTTKTKLTYSAIKDKQRIINIKCYATEMENDV